MKSARRGGTLRDSSALFNEAVDQAAALCPVSNALRGNVEISVAAVGHGRLLAD
jgi:organic hydroperoxide reductase OsmC/OhrA